MPDLDGELAELRAQLRHTVHQPEVATVIERSRQRRIRRRTQLGAVAAVLVVGATIPLLRSTLRPVAEDPVSPATSTTSPPPQTPWRYHYDLDFADDRHGYALRANCTDRTGAGCTLELMATEDGERWEARKLPDAVAHTGESTVTHLYVLGPRSVTVGRTYPQRLTRYYSADAGRSWATVSPGTPEKAATIPSGAMIQSGCVHVNDPACRPGLAIIVPGTGQLVELASQPPVRDPVTASPLPVSGAWWVSGVDPDSGERRLAVSRDDGRTWSTAGLPSWRGNTLQVSMAASGTTLYTAVTVGQDDTSRGLLMIFRSADNGKRWEQTFQAVNGTEPQNINGSLLATTDGRLVMATEHGEVWASGDGGRHFTPAPREGDTTVIAQTRGGYLAVPLYGVSNVYKLSQDGVTWRQITIE